MEQTHSTELFSLTIDPLTKAHLTETARWAKFLAIVGFVFLVLMVVAGIVLSVYMYSAMNGIDEDFSRRPRMWGNLGAGAVALGYSIGAVIVFFPLLFLLRFSKQMRVALAGNDQQALNTSFLNLKACLRYLGIVTIIALALYALTITMGIIGTAAFS